MDPPICLVLFHHIPLLMSRLRKEGQKCREVEHGPLQACNLYSSLSANEMAIALSWCMVFSGILESLSHRTYPEVGMMCPLMMIPPASPLGRKDVRVRGLQPFVATYVNEVFYG